jgi:hypothetical protein
MTDFDEVKRRLNRAVERLIEDFPEMEHVAIIPIWSFELESDPQTLEQVLQAGLTPVISAGKPLKIDGVGILHAKALLLARQTMGEVVESLRVSGGEENDNQAVQKNEEGER